MSETKTAEEILRQYFPPPKSEAEKNDDINIVKFAKEHSNQQNQELQSKMFTWEKDYLDLQLRNQELKRQLDLKIIGYDDLYSKYTQLKDAADEMANTIDNLESINKPFTLNDLYKAREAYKHLTNKL